MVSLERLDSAPTILSPNLVTSNVVDPVAFGQSQLLSQTSPTQESIWLFVATRDYLSIRKGNNQDILM